MPEAASRGSWPRACRHHTGWACSSISSSAIGSRRRGGFELLDPGRAGEAARGDHDGQPRVDNMYLRCVTREGNLRAQEQLWRVFRPWAAGGAASRMCDGNLRLRDEWAHVDARRRFRIDVTGLWDGAPSVLVQDCVCGDHGGDRLAFRLPARSRQGVPAGDARGRLHGLEARAPVEFGTSTAATPISEARDERALALLRPAHRPQARGGRTGHAGAHRGGLRG